MFSETWLGEREVCLGTLRLIKVCLTGQGSGVPATAIDLAFVTVALCEHTAEKQA